MSGIRIDVVSDVMCPWCWIGKRRLSAALQQVGDLEVDVHWRPFQLDPTLPPQGKDRRAYLEQKFGGPERAAAIYARIEEAGAAEGLPFAFGKIGVSPNTLDAHRVIRWSSSEPSDVREGLVEGLFAAFFRDGRNIGDHDVLTEVAADAGMDGDIVRDLLASDRDVDETRQEIDAAARMGVTGVPFFIIDERYGVQGAQDPDVLATAIRQAARERAAD